MSTNLFQHTVYKTHNSDVRENLRELRESNHHHSTKSSSSKSSSKKTSDSKKLTNAMTIFSTLASVAMTGLSMANMSQSIFGKSNNGTTPTNNTDKSQPSFEGSKKDNNYVQLGAGLENSTTATVVSSIATAQNGTAQIEKALESYRKDGDVNALKSSLASEAECNAQAVALETITKESDRKVEIAQNQVTKAIEVQTENEKALETAETKENTAKDNHSAAVNAEKAYNSADSAYTVAYNTYTRLKGTYDAMPETIIIPPATTPVANPAKATLEIKVEAARIEMEAKKEALRLAKEAYNKTGTSVAAQQAWDTAKQERAAVEKKVKETKEDIKALKESLETAKKEASEVRKNQQAAKSANDKWAKAIAKAKTELQNGGYINKETTSNKLDTKGLYDYSAPKSSKNFATGLRMDESIFLS